jgi:PAS domain S-box-containing protein
MKKVTKLRETILIMREFITILESYDLTGKPALTAHEKTRLRENNEKYLEDLDNQGKVIWIINNEGRNIFVNPKGADLFGYRIEEIIGQYLFNFMDEPMQNEALNNFINKKRDAVEEAKFIRKNGKTIWNEIENHTLYDSAGKITGRIAILTDITAAKTSKN